jgi:hypothetical protein
LTIGISFENMQYQVRDMNSFNDNSNAVAGEMSGVCVVVGTAAAEAAEGDTMSSEVRVG